MGRRCSTRSGSACAHDADMKLLRRRSTLRILVAGWTANVWITFVRNDFTTTLPDPHFSSGFKAIHAFITLGSLATAVVVARIGLQSLSEERSTRGLGAPARWTPRPRAGGL